MRLVFEVDLRAAILAGADVVGGEGERASKVEIELDPGHFTEGERQVLAAAMSNQNYMDEPLPTPLGNRHVLKVGGDDEAAVRRAILSYQDCCQKEQDLKVAMRMDESAKEER